MRYVTCLQYDDGARTCPDLWAGQRPILAWAAGTRGRAAASEFGLMLWRIVVALLRSPLTVVYAVLCLGLSALGLGGAYLLLTLGLETLGDPLPIWLLAGFGLLWGGFWLYLLGVVVRAAVDDEA
jgi:hypothetical protein